MGKSRDAFRTISEVSEWLDTPAHVLRFWESKFSQIKPVKRAGGRRYYRPEDMELLAGIKTLLHQEGLTIKGAQKLLREKGIKHVSSLATEPDLTGEPPIEATALASHDAAPEPDKVVPISGSRRSGSDTAPESAGGSASAAPTRSPSRPDRRHIFTLIAGADPAQLRRRSARVHPLLDRLRAIAQSARDA